MILRSARQSDSQAIYELDQQFGPDAFSLRQVKYHTSKNPDKIVVAELDGIVVGYAMIATRSGSRKARLYSICVSDDVKGRGLGKSLLNGAQRLAIDLGMTEMTLEVSTKNERAKKLYDTNGYITFGLYQRYYSDGSDAFRMIKSLI